VPLGLRVLVAKLPHAALDAPLVGSSSALRVVADQDRLPEGDSVDDRLHAVMRGARVAAPSSGPFAPLLGSGLAALAVGRVAGFYGSRPAVCRVSTLPVGTTRLLGAAGPTDGMLRARPLATHPGLAPGSWYTRAASSFVRRARNFGDLLDRQREHRHLIAGR